MIQAGRETNGKGQPQKATQSAAFPTHTLTLSPCRRTGCRPILPLRQMRSIRVMHLHIAAQYEYPPEQLFSKNKPCLPCVQTFRSAAASPGSVLSGMHSTICMLWF